MKKYRLYIFVSLVAMYICTACNLSGGKIANADTSRKPIVTVNEYTLYQGDLEDAISASLHGEDSIVATEGYIKAWINDKLMYDKAHENLINEARIRELVDEYKKNLVVNSYQEHLLKEYFSKNTTESNLRSYFDQNKDAFKLEEPIIKGLYLKIPSESSQLKNFRSWYSQTTDKAIENIEKNSVQHAVSYEFFYDKWVSLSNVLENIPHSISNYEQFLKNNKNMEFSDSTFVYFLNIRDYKLPGTETPYEYIKDKLPEIYIEKNRTSFLKETQEDLYNKAVSNNSIKYYNK